MEMLYRLADGKVEALEFKVLHNSECIGKSLKDMNIREGVLITALIRGNKNIIPDGNTVIQADDHAIIVSLAGKLESLDDILKDER